VTRRYVYLASLLDAAIIGSHLGDVHGGIPPPGFELFVGDSRMPRGAPQIGIDEVRLPVYVEVPDEATEFSGWWTSTIGDLLLVLTGTDQSLLADWATRLVDRFGGIYGDVLGAPVVVKGKGPDRMRWLETTHRGLLFGEQFQHHLAWGKPGDDPTTDEAAALEFAELLATNWSTIFATSLLTAFNGDVVYTEVGVVEMTQDDPGGHVSESYGTQWFMYPTGTRPTGGAATTSLPYEVACAVSLQTDRRGGSGKGRFYLPPFSKDSVTNHGLFNMGVVSPVIAAIGAYIDAVKATSDLVPIVVSRKFRSLNEVKSITCGVVPDSQRRRRRQLSEARVAEWTAA